mgnify:CR=1 FL=1
MADTKGIDVRYVAQLARLDLTEKEIAQFQGQLGDILQYVEQLNQIDVSGVEPTAHAIARFNVFREDTPKESLSQETALSNAPQKANQLFIVPKIVE